MKTYYRTLCAPWGEVLTYDFGQPLEVISVRLVSVQFQYRATRDIKGSLLIHLPGVHHRALNQGMLSHANYRVPYTWRCHYSAVTGSTGDFEYIFVNTETNPRVDFHPRAHFCSDITFSVQLIDTNTYLMATGLPDQTLMQTNTVGQVSLTVEIVTTET